MFRSSNGLDYVRDQSTLNLCFTFLFKVLNRQSLYRAYPTAWIFLACPPDPSVRCISPGFYAVLGASAMLAGVTRMTSVLVNCLSTSAPFLLIRQLIFSISGGYFV